MPSISIAAGKFAVYRTDSTSGANPVTEIIAVTDGGACGIKDHTGKIWIFRCYNAKLEYKRSTDTIGTVWGAWTEIVGAAIADGIPGACQYQTSAIEVIYYKTDDKLYRSVTRDYGTTWDAEEEITT